MGPMGVLHTGIVNSLPGSRLVAISDVDPRVVAPIRDLIPDIAFYADHVEMLSESHLDAVYVCTPLHTHARIVEDIVQLKDTAAIFVEKPLAENSTVAKHLLDVSESHNVVTAVGFQRRFAPTLREAKRILATGVIGTPKLIRAFHLSSGVLDEGTGWRFSTGSGGMVREFGPHILDSICYLFGPPRVVGATVQKLFSREVDDYASVSLETKAGVRAGIEICWSFRNYPVSDFRIEVHGKKGALSVTNERIVLYMDEAAEGYKSGITKIDVAQLAQPLPFFLGAYENVAIDMHFLDCVANHKTTEVPFAQGVLVNRLIDSILEAGGMGLAPTA